MKKVILILFILLISTFGFSCICGSGATVTESNTRLASSNTQCCLDAYVACTSCGNCVGGDAWSPSICTLISGGGGDDTYAKYSCCRAANSTGTTNISFKFCVGENGTCGGVYDKFATGSCCKTNCSAPLCGQDNGCGSNCSTAAVGTGYVNSCDTTDICGNVRTTGAYNSCDLTSNIPCGNDVLCDGLDNDCDAFIDEGCPFGYLDSASCESGLVGWARDSRNANGVGIIDDAVALSNDLNVHFYYVAGNGPASTTNIYLGEVLANLDSSDVGSHRFNKSIIIPGAVVGEKYTFGAWGINVGEFSNGNPSLTNNKTLTINSEICDGLDNDCDGIVDEGLNDVSSGCNQVGVCSGSVRSCVEGDWTECSTIPSEEYCDYLDNDCDGVVDDAVDCLAVPCHNCSSLESLINIDTLGAVFTSNNIVLDLNIFCDVSSIDGTKVVNVNSVLVKKNDEVVPAVLSAPVLGCNSIPVRRQVVVDDCDELNYTVSFGFDSNEPYCYDANNCLGLSSVLSVVDCASSDFKWNGLKVSTGVAEVGGSQNISDGSIYSALIIILGIFFLTTKKKE